MPLHLLQAAPQGLDQLQIIERLGFHQALQQPAQEAAAVELRAGVAQQIAQHQDPQQVLEGGVAQAEQRLDAVDAMKIEHVGQDQRGVFGRDQIQQPLQRGVVELQHQALQQAPVLRVTPDQADQPGRIVTNELLQQGFDRECGAALPERQRALRQIVPQQLEPGRRFGMDVVVGWIRRVAQRVLEGGAQCGVQRVFGGLGKIVERQLAEVDVQPRDLDALLGHREFVEHPLDDR